MTLDIGVTVTSSQELRTSHATNDTKMICLLYILIAMHNGLPKKANLSTLFSDACPS